jgi:hypothetical protein
VAESFDQERRPVVVLARLLLHKSNKQKKRKMEIKFDKLNLI